MLFQASSVRLADPENPDLETQAVEALPHLAQFAFPGGERHRQRPNGKSDAEAVEPLPHGERLHLGIGLVDGAIVEVEGHGGDVEDEQQKEEDGAEIREADPRGIRFGGRGNYYSASLNPLG